MIDLRSFLFGIGTPILATIISIFIIMIIDKIYDTYYILRDNISDIFRDTSSSRRKLDEYYLRLIKIEEFMEKIDKSLINKTINVN